ncbi:MAG TPA: AAA-like domain-containing protein [Elainellaceae cyanobacterium]
MSTSMYEYRVGGSLGTTDPTYIKRRADTTLYQSLLAGEFCYVLTSRQMGKSSLRMQMRHQIEQSGQGRCASIDISRIGSEHINPNQWYQGIAFDLLRNLKLARVIDLKQWWAEQGDISPVQKLSHLVEDILSNHLSAPQLFIFLDEIDSVKSLNFSVDDFFAFIRFCYNNRAENSIYQRLTWALFGVASPSELIADARRTPFNIGKAIALPGFTFSAAQPLAQGLIGMVDRPDVILQEILNWTNGQPFLTQKLCCLVQMMHRDSVDGKLRIPPGTEAYWVENLVRSHVIDDWDMQDEPEHLKTIRDRLLRNEHRAGRLLGLYQRIHHQGSVTAIECSEQTELLLSGIVIPSQGRIIINNRIYAEVFSLAWVTQQLAQLRPYAASFQAWVDSGLTDESRLLSGKALEEALNWSHDKSLSDLDYRFLTASQELDSHLIRLELEATNKAKRTLANAQKKAKRIILAGYVSLAMCLMMSAIVIWISRMLVN